MLSLIMGNDQPAYNTLFRGLAKLLNYRLLYVLHLYQHFTDSESNQTHFAMSICQI